MKVGLEENHHHLPMVDRFVSRLVVMDKNKMYIGSYINCLRKQFSLSKLPPSVLSKTQHTKDVLSSLLKLWKDFFNSVPSDIVEKLLETLDYRIVSMYRAVPDEYWCTEKQDYIYAQFITPFHLAAWSGDLEFLDYFHLHHQTIWKQYSEFPDLLGNLPLHCCFFNFDAWQEPISPAIQLSVLLGTNLNVRNALGFSPLHIACIANQPRGVLYLREQDIDLSIPVHFFSDHLNEVIDQIDTVREICRFQPTSYHDCHPSCSDSWRCGSCSSVLGGSLYSYEGSFEDRVGMREGGVQSSLIRMPSMQSSHYELEGFTPLHLALIADAPRCAYFLLESVEDLLQYGKTSIKPIEVISLYSHAIFSYFTSIQSQILFSLLPKEWHSYCTPNQDLLQSTLMNGILSRNYSSVIKILSTNINLNATYFSHMYSPLHIACVLLDETFIRLFIGYGADPRKRTASGDSCLHLVLKSQSESPNAFTRSNLLGLLMMSGCDPCQPDAKGVPPIFHAVRKGDISSVSILLAYDADPTVYRDIPTGHNAFQEAIRLRHEDIVRLIFKRYPHILLVPDIYNHYPLYYVVKNHEVALFVYLLNYTPPLTDKVIADLVIALHEENPAIADCVNKQLCYVNHTCTNLNRYRLNFFLPNNKVEKCMQCGKKFSLITVKRHCRRCGQILCSNCCQDDHDKTKDHICNKCRKFNNKDIFQLPFLQQFEDGIKSYLVKIPKV